MSNKYRFDGGTEDESYPSENPVKISIESVKDIGGIPLPKSEDLPRWFLVLGVIVGFLVLGFIGVWLNKEMDFKNQQIKECNENFQNLNVNYILKDLENQKLKQEAGLPITTEDNIAYPVEKPLP